MSIKFNADEIFEIAQQMERNGSKFYRRTAECAAASDHKQRLIELAAMEDGHEKTFSAMRAELTPEEREPTVFDPDNEAALYLQAMADGYVFDVKTDACERLTGNEKMEEILQIAIGLEKDSIVFYSGLRDLVPERLGKEWVDQIIKQELGHVADLSKELASLK